MRERFLSLIVIFALTLSLVSCFSEPVGYGHGELKLNLPRSFGDFDADGAYDIAYSREGMVVGILRLSFDMCRKEGVLDNMSPTVFAEFYKGKAGDLAGEIETEGDIPYFTYALLGEDNISYTYMPTFYVSHYAYFVVTFITKTEDFDEERANISDYLSDITFDYSKIERP